MAQFSLRFIKEGIIEEKWGKLVRQLFNKRQKADYTDFVDASEAEVISLLSHVDELRRVLKELIQQA